MNELETEKTVTLHLSSNTNAHWQIAQYPTWLKLSELEGDFSNGETTIDLKVPNKYLIQQLGLINAPLIFEVEGLGLVQFPFQILNYGYPESFYNTDHLTIEHRTKNAFYIQNSGQGILSWKITNKPDWLTISKSNGLLSSSEEVILSVNVSRENLAIGTYSGLITIQTNSPEQIKTINVTMDVLDFTFAGKVKAFLGNVVDVDYNQNTGFLVIAAQNPNRLYYEKIGQPFTYLELNRIPTSVDISETGDQFAITFTNTDLTLFNSESLNEVKTLKTGIIASDIALGGNGWAYITPLNYTTNHLLSVNLNSNTIVQHKDDMNGLTILKKVPGKNLIYGSKVGWGPDYLFVFDVSNGAINDQYDQYYMELWKFWLSEDGTHLFTGLKQKYKSPEYLSIGYTMNKPLLEGEFQLAGTINAIAPNSAVNDIFVAYQSYSEMGTTIARIDANNMVIKESVKVNNGMFVENENLINLPPIVPYIYATKSGKELYIIKKIDDNNARTFWFFEKMVIN